MECQSTPTSSDAQTIRELADDIFRERVRRARRMKPEEKLSAGSELFEYAASITLAGIHAQHPGISDEQALQIFAERLAMRERMEHAAWTSKPPSSG